MGTDAPDTNATPDVGTLPTPAPASTQQPLAQPPAPASAPGTANAPGGTYQPGTFDKIVAGLNTPNNLHVDPDTGKTVGDPNYSRGSLATHIVAAAILGMLKGVGAPPGPGHVAQAASLGAQAGGQLAERPYQQAQNEYETQQQAQVTRYQVAHLNAQLATDSANTLKAGAETADKIKQMNDPAVQQLAANGSIETDESGNPVAYTQADIMQKVKSGDLNAGDTIGMSYGATQGADGKLQNLFVVNKNPNAPVTMDQDTYDKLTAEGVNIPKEVVGQPIPSKSYSAYVNQASVHTTGTATLNVLREDAGDNKDLAAKIPSSIDPKTPGMATALRMYQRGLIGAGGDPLKALEAVQQQSPQSAQVLAQAFGGMDTLQALSQQRADNAAKSKGTAEEAGKLAAQPDQQKPNPDDVTQFQGKTLPAARFLSQDQRDDLSTRAAQAKTVADLNKIQDEAFKTNTSGQEKYIAEQNMKANKDATVASEIGKKSLDDINKAWADPQHGFTQVQAQASNTKAAIRDGADGAGLMTSLVPTMEVLGVNSFGQTHRISPVEANAAGAPGGLMERFNAWATKAESGKLTPQLAKEGNQLMDQLIMAAHDKAVLNSRIYVGNAKAGGATLDPSLVTVSTIHGQPDTLAHQLQVMTPPPGATGRATDPKTGKLHWTDGKTDLGEAE